MLVKKWREGGGEIGGTHKWIQWCGMVETMETDQG